MLMRTLRVECIPSREGFDTVLKVHMDIGHWSVDHVKLYIRDKFFWPHIDTDAWLACLWTLQEFWGLPTECLIATHNPRATI